VAAPQAGQNHASHSLNPCDRLIDISPKVVTSEGGAGITDWSLDADTLTSMSAWRWWQWHAENDRDYTGLPIQTSQHIPSRQDQYSEELCIASNSGHTLD